MHLLPTNGLLLMIGDEQLQLLKTAICKELITYKCYLLKIDEVLYHFKVGMILIFILKLPDVKRACYSLQQEKDAGYVYHV